MRKVLHIWDLDHTIFDSSARQKYDGKILCLKHWKENSTDEKILQDKILPLADLMRAQFEQAHNTIIICTSRVMQDADFQLLKNHRVNFHHCLSRDESDSTSDGPFKKILIQNFLKEFGPFSRKFIYDDNERVLNMAVRELGLVAYDSKILNKVMHKSPTTAAFLAARY